MTGEDPRYVTWDRWDAEHEDLERRVSILEAWVQHRSDRLWAVALLLLGSLAFPLIVGAILAYALRAGP